MEAKINTRILFSVKCELTENELRALDALVFYVTYFPEGGFDGVWNFMLDVRKVQSSPIVIVLDEAEIVCEKIESLFKTMLDGHLSINDSIVLATTNYYDKIPDTIKNRPSRFKYCFNIEGIQEESVIEDIITKSFLNRFSSEEIKSFALELKGGTIDTIKHFCLDKIFNIQVENRKKKIGF